MLYCELKYRAVVSFLWQIFSKAIISKFSEKKSIDKTGRGDRINSGYTVAKSSFGWNFF